MTVASEARLIDRTSVDKVHEFLETYCNRGDWPLRLYRLRTLAPMPEINMAIELTLDWLTTYAIVWPLKLENKFFTPTEIARQRRILYLMELGFTLFDLIEDTSTEGFRKAIRRLWHTFSDREIYECYMLLTRVWRHWKCRSALEANSSYCTRANYLDPTWSKIRGRCQDELTNWPWHAGDELQGILNFMRRGLYVNGNAIWNILIDDRSTEPPFANDPSHY